MGWELPVVCDGGIPVFVVDPSITPDLLGLSRSRFCIT